MKSNYKDLTGKRFGRLVALEIKETGTRKTYWICQCDCGNIKAVRSDSLQCGAIKSCGCMKLEQDRVNLEANHKHKMSHKRPYEIWQGMKRRCHTKSCSCYDRYGGRGITVCDEWRYDFSKFWEWAQNNGYSDELTIDRIDNDKGYSPDNCRWVDNRTQCNNRSSNIMITIGKATKSITEWCSIFGLKSKTVLARYKRNPDIDVFDLFSP